MLDRAKLIANSGRIEKHLNYFQGSITAVPYIFLLDRQEDADRTIMVTQVMGEIDLVQMAVQVHGDESEIWPDGCGELPCLGSGTVVERRRLG